MIRRAVTVLVVLALSGCGSNAAQPPVTGTVTATPTAEHVAAWPVPDPKLTPGAVEACTLPRPKAQRDVTAATRRQVLAAYHYIGPTDAKHIELDHRVPFALCGTNDARNLWVEPADPGTVPKGFTANSKDALEAYVIRQVQSGKITLEAGQRVFLGDWRIAYCMMLKSATYGACLRMVEGK